ncbi:MAG: flagellar basal body rod protein FlgC [Planctomycetota bacterium]|jgi:flagellar basal-body rod protein FlgC|nr:flagellar basal body rod protein FlgC [Planctomycetota bacterium]|tara:strand:+ start:600 stop:1007 length:408 start_codon:yes stop_codon:yes gene_type:complete
MFGTLDVSASALRAERVRMHTIANNLANLHTTRDESGEINPYRRRTVRFQVGLPGVRGSRQGVHVEQVVHDSSPFPKIYDPGHPEADEEGYRLTPNVHPVVEMVDMLETTRAYEANLTAMEATKGMITRALGLLV